MSENKKQPKFGKTIIVCAAAIMLGILLTFIGPILEGMDRYNNHEHMYLSHYDSEYSSGYCYYCDYDNAFSYAMEGYDGYLWLAIFVGGSLAIAGAVMGIIYAVRKAKAAKPQVEQTASAAPISIPVGEGEQIVLERRYPSAFPIVMMVLGVLSALISIFFFVNYDEEIGIPLLIVGGVFLVVGILLSKALKIHLVVTTKRVYLKAPLACRMNLPLNRISAVGTGLFHYLSITSAAGLAGQIRLFFVPEYLEVYDTINALLNDVE